MEKRDKLFTLKVSEEEKAMLRAIARWFKASASDVLRTYIVRTYADVIVQAAGSKEKKRAK